MLSDYFLLQLVGELDQVSELLPVLLDDFVIMVDPPALIAFEHSSKVLVKEPQLLLHCKL